jgi:predicted alpha/beta-hydrolase family hydrolase
MRTVQVEWSPGNSVTVRHLEGERSPVVLLAHGAGVNQDHPLQVGVRDGISERGFGVATFNYPYTEAGKQRPDRSDKLLACHRAVADSVSEATARGIVLAGRSMGGRIGTMLAADGYPAVGLIALAYPLHPIGKPESLRVAHLSAITAPVLMVIGDRDPMCTMHLYDEHVRGLPNVTTRVIEDGDHSFRVRRKMGRTNEEARVEILDAVEAFLVGLPTV